MIQLLRSRSSLDSGARPARGRSESGMTAVEILVSLILLSFLAVFMMGFVEYSSRVHVRILQLDHASQVARDILAHLKNGVPWAEVRMEFSGIRRFDTDFTVEFQTEEVSGPGQEGVVHLELTVSWVGPMGLEQEVFNTTVFQTASEGGGPEETHESPDPEGASEG